MDLYRSLEPKYKYDKYFPKTSCKREVIGFGDTNFGVKQMAQWATKHSWQAGKIAKRLKADTLLKTLENVHQFIYNNFQYKPDDDDQHMQSIACAWQMREDGINCKGYSTVASSILQQLGIRHYIRRVSYDGDNYTHVFIVVPVDNNEIIIDGTLPRFNYTPTYLTKKDLEVMPQKLKYIGMNAPGANPINEELLSKILQILQNKGVQNVDSVKELMLSTPNQLTFMPLGLKAGNKFLPFHFSNVPVEIINQVVNNFLKKVPKFNGSFLPVNPFGMNGLDFGGGGFGGFSGGGFGGGQQNSLGYTPSFGVDLNLGGNSAGGGVTASSGSNSGGGGGFANTLNAITGLLSTSLNFYNSITGNNSNQTSGTTTVRPPQQQNTGGSTLFGGGQTNYPPQNTGYVGAPLPPLAQMPAAKKWYEQPITLVAITIGGIVMYKIVTNSNSKQKK